MAPATQTDRTQISTWVPTSLASELQARATAAERSLSAELRKLIRESFENGAASSAVQPARVSLDDSGVARAGSNPSSTERTA